jgi:putative phage-type endonuclease
MTYTINNCDQGTDEWLAARKGKLTASRADEIITPTGKLSAGARKLMIKLTRECIIDDPNKEKVTPAMQWGHDYEPIARAMFEKETGYAVETVGMLQSALSPCLACSPDGLFMIGDVIHGLEIKCPSVDTHCEYVIDGQLPAKYRPQVHFSMAITGIRTWYFMSYFPADGIKQLILPVHWDEYTDKMQAAAIAFAKEYEVEMPKILEAISL